MLYFVVKPTGNQNYLVKSVDELPDFNGRIVTTSENEEVCKVIADVLNKERTYWEED